MKIYSLLFAVIVILLVFSGAEALRSDEPAGVSITSSRENDVLTFELIGIDESKEENGHLGKKQTPFEMKIEATNYNLLAHKLDGKGDLVVTFMVKNGNVTTYQPISFIRKRGIALSSIGFGQTVDKH